MPIPEQRDLTQARVILAAWLANRLPDASEVQVGPITGPSSTGFSNETLLFDASWVTNGTAVTESLVLRVKPTQHTVFLEADFEQQYLVIRTLGERTRVPVPPVRWYEPDETVLGAPFFVMSKVEGRVPADSPAYTMEGWLLEGSTPEQRRTLVDLVARIGHDHQLAGVRVDTGLRKREQRLARSGHGQHLGLGVQPSQVVAAHQPGGDGAAQLVGSARGRVAVEPMHTGRQPLEHERRRLMFGLADRQRNAPQVRWSLGAGEQSAQPLERIRLQPRQPRIHVRR